MIVIVTQMKEVLDGTVHPPREHSTKEAAMSYAKQRSAEKQCEITVAGDGFDSVTFHDGKQSAN